MGHLNYAASLITGIAKVQDGRDVVALVHDLAIRLASSSCQMLANLIAHFILTEFLPPQAIPLNSPGFPVFEYKPTSCCGRENVLYDLLLLVVERFPARIHPLRVAEIG